MNPEPERDWNARYSAADASPAAAQVLRDYRHLLPNSGRALDLACGLGGNALFLAEHSLQAHAWDASAVAIAKLKAHAAARNLTVHTEVRDVVAQPPEPGGFDVIVVSRFLDRGLAPALIAALRPNGLLFYQTFTRIKVDDSPLRNPAHLLDDNELLSLFAPLRVRAYREENRLGDIQQGLRNAALLVAEKV